MGWKSKKPWYKEFGEWLDKEATPFVVAGVRGTLAGGPYMGVASAITATNKRGGNPLGKFGKEAEKIVQPVLQITEAVNVLKTAASVSAEAAAKKAAKETAKPKVVFC